MRKVNIGSATENFRVLEQIFLMIEFQRTKEGVCSKLIRMTPRSNLCFVRVRYKDKRASVEVYEQKTAPSRMRF